MSDEHIAPVPRLISATGGSTVCTIAFTGVASDLANYLMPLRTQDAVASFVHYFRSAQLVSLHVSFSARNSTSSYRFACGCLPDTETSAAGYGPYAEVRESFSSTNAPINLSWNVNLQHFGTELSATVLHNRPPSVFIATSVPAPEKKGSDAKEFVIGRVVLRIRVSGEGDI
jgi:hypothetical protein